MRLRLLKGRREILVEKIFTLVQKHVRAWPPQPTPVLGRFSEVYLSFDVLDDGHACVVELHPLPLALHDRVVVSELEALSFVDHDAFQMVGSALSFHIRPQFLWEGDPII